MASSREPLDPSLLTDELVRTVSSDGSVSVRAIVGTEIVREAARLQGLGPTAVTALGRALLGTVLVAAGAQEDETVQIQFRGDGPLGIVLAIAEQNGRVRGTVSNPGGAADPSDDRSMIAASVGTGILSVVRSHPRWKEPYRGIIPLDSGEIGLDIARYLTDSEQTPSAIGLGVGLDERGDVAAAGGFLVQALPGADDAVVARIEGNVRAIWSTAELIQDGSDAAAIVDLVLSGVGSSAHHHSTPHFHCPCTRERVARTVVLLGRKELREIIAKREELEVRCEFCGERYVLGPDQLGGLLPDA